MRLGLSLVLAAALVAVGVALAGFFASQTILNGRIGANTAAVKGLSERLVESDKGRWEVRYSFTERDYTQVDAVFARLDGVTERLRQILRDKGFAETEIYAAPPVRRDETERNSDGQIVDRYYAVATTLTVATDEPAKIEPARAPVLALAREGLNIYENTLDYSFTRLNDIKPDMLREATENARIAADEFARNAGVAVGGIRDATQGGFQITDAPGTLPGSTQKLVRVVTNVTFYLEN